MTSKTNGKKIVVVGAGQIGTPLVKRLVREGHAVTWVSRTPPSAVPEGAVHAAVDVCDADALARVATGAHAVIAAMNPATYDAEVWARTLPPMHRGLVEGTGRAGARLVLLDALYLYALGEGPLSPRTRVAPATEKGKVRKQTAEILAEAQARGAVRATVLRAPDFWGPGLASALLTEDAVRGLRAGKRPMIVGDPDAPHAFSHRDDVVDALVTLAFADEDVVGRVFHAPVIHETPRRLVGAVAAALGKDVSPRVAPAWLLKLAGLFDASTRGLVEMIPQWDAPYLVDDSDYRARFGRTAITLEEGARSMAEA